MKDLKLLFSRLLKKSTGLNRTRENEIGNTWSHTLDLPKMLTCLLNFSEKYRYPRQVLNTQICKRNKPVELNLKINLGVLTYKKLLTY